ncbi:MAG: hypothetical protein Rhob2KO_15320 [Rhodopirellula baltica]
MQFRQDIGGADDLIADQSDFGDDRISIFATKGHAVPVVNMVAKFWFGCGCRCLGLASAHTTTATAELSEESGW